MNYDFSKKKKEENYYIHGGSVKWVAYYLYKP